MKKLLVMGILVLSSMSFAKLEVPEDVEKNINKLEVLMVLKE